jgi:DNA gyrase subunit A
MPPQKPSPASVQTSFELNQSGPIKPVEFHEIFGQNYGVYGLHVVQERALPDARDGLKPVQRRILYTLWEGNYRASGPHRKSAEIVGKVLGDRHPHGDSSVYEAMVRMVQPFTMRYPFVDGQGNWGASDGSPAAAYRYTEAKLTQLAEALLSDDLRKETVPLDLTYKEDSKVLEPRYLPGHLPPCVNPIDGIAVGISTAVPPHNLGETLRACIAMLDGGVLEGTDKGKGFSTEQLMEYLPGPDFPEGGRVMLASGGVREYLETGRGRFVVRADISLEQLTPTRRALVITGLPPTSRDKVITSIIDAINDRRPGLEGLVAEPPLDETNEARTRIVLELKRDANPALVLDSLYKHTLLQIGVSAQLYFLFADQPQAAATRPRQIGMVELLTYWLHHQLDVLERRLSFELRQYRHRLAVVEALIIGATHAQELVKIFQNAEGKGAAKLTIQAKYKLSEEQAEVIANMSLSQVTRPDAGKYQQEKAELEKQITGHEALLSSRDRRVALLKKELQETAKKFGDARRTVLDRSEMAGVGPGAGGAASTSPSGSRTPALSGENKVSATTTATATGLKSAVVREPLALALYNDGTIKATPLDQFGPKVKTVKSDENLTELIAVPGEAFVLAASSAGRVFGVPVEKLAVTNRGGKGESLVRHLKLERGERIVSLLAVPASGFEAAQGQGGADQTAEAEQALLLYLVEVSAQGKIKKTALSEYKTANSGGLSSLKLAQGDEVVAALLSNGQGEYVLTADNNQTLRFGDDRLSAQGRVGQGQNAMALDGGARIISAGFWSGIGSEVGAEETATAEAEARACLIVLTKKGLLKRTPLEEYPAKGRATGGVATTLLNVGDSVVATRLVRLTQALPQPLLVASGEGAVAVVELATQIPLLARAKKGQPLSASPGNNGATNGTGSGSKTARLVPLALKLG